MAAVDEVLESLAHSTRAGMLVLNKIDNVADPIELQFLAKDRTERICHLSAVTGEGVDRLDAMISKILDARSALLQIRLPLADGRSAALVRQYGLVQEEAVEGDQYLVFRVRMDEGALGNLKRAAGGDLDCVVLEPALEPLIEQG
jgi:GTPase